MPEQVAQGRVYREDDQQGNEMNTRVGTAHAPSGAAPPASMSATAPQPDEEPVTA